MPLKIEVISKEIIKPSSPTPHNLKTFKLSLLDQYMIGVYVPVILFYSATDKQEEDLLLLLKKSLSETLTQFYPLAGRINTEASIDCNDEGISFSRARVTCKLSQLIEHPSDEELQQLLPTKSSDFCSSSSSLVLVQVNTFDCGGTALGVSISHQVADVSSLCLFLQSWAALSSGAFSYDRNPFAPDFGLSSLFPPKDKIPFTLLDIFIIGFAPQPLTVNRQGVVVTKRFLFNASNLQKLQAKYSKNSTTTRVQAVAALIWRCHINVLRANKSLVNTAAMIPANRRGRMDPPFPPNLFGNFSNPSLATASITGAGEEDGDDYLAGLLREAIGKTNTEYVKDLLTENDDGDGVFRHYVFLREFFQRQGNGELKVFPFTSWCKFGIYDLDFGFGKPIWNYTITSKGCNTLMDTKCGTGIEAWVSLEEEDMAIFERDPCIIAFTSSAAAAQGQTQ